MTSPIDFARTSGLSNGHDDAETWISERVQALAEEDREMDPDDLRRSLNFQETGIPVEGLIDGLRDVDLVELVGSDVRDADGDWSPEAIAFFAAYNEGWREAVDKHLAEAA